MPSEKLTFPSAHGEALAGRLERPEGPVRAVALFAHCFTCTKDVLAARTIARTLAEHGIAVLRFDFTGLGHSEGEFANTNFSSNVEDLIAAADHLRDSIGAPRILIGHSLGGAAVIAAAGRIPDARAVVTVGAPSDPAHVAHNFETHIEDIERDGEAEVMLAGRPFRVRKQFLDDVREQSLKDHLARLGKALLVLHSPIDQTVGISNASDIFVTAKHPKSFITLDDADHLLSRQADASYAARVISAWVARYLGEEAAAAGQPTKAAPAAPGDATAGEDGVVVVRETGVNPFQQTVQVGPHTLTADEPVSYGGGDTGPSPYDLLVAGLGACTAMTLRMYATRKAMALERVEVRLKHRKVHSRDCAGCEDDPQKIDEIERTITLVGPSLSEDDRARLLKIADRCPVHQTLERENRIVTALA